MAVSLSSSSRPPHRARDQAVDALREGRPERAAELARAALQADPLDALAAQALGHALLRLDRAREAAAALQGLAARCRDPATETLYARALASAGRQSDAVEQLRQTTSQRPAFALAFLELGEVLARQGRFEEALEALAEGVSLAPEADVLRVGLGRLRLRLGDRDGARALLSDVLRRSPQRADAKISLAKLLELEGDYAGAADLYRSALQTRPGGDTRIHLGKCLLELGEREAGEAALKAAAADSAAARGLAVAALAATPRGRLFLRPSAAASFLLDEAA